MADIANNSATAATAPGSLLPTAQPQGNQEVAINRKAFLELLASHESGGDYQKVQGGSRFTGFGDHPRIDGPDSNAAGKYQFLSTTWDEVRGRYPDITDFSPKNQDKAAIYYISYMYPEALTAIDRGDWKTASNLLNGLWTSLPGGPQPQSTSTIEHYQGLWDKYQSELRARVARGEKIEEINVSSSAGSGGSAAGASGGAGAGIAGFLTVFLDPNCKPPTNQWEAIRWVGCLVKQKFMTPGPGQNLGVTPNGIGGMGAPANMPAANPGAPNAGGWIVPLGTGYTFMSPFGPRGGRNHNGVDLAAPEGTPIMAAKDGSVYDVQSEGTSGGYGNFVILDHGNSTPRYSRYAHLDKVGVTKGANVTRGQVVGTIGMTGNTSGPHLHFELCTGPASGFVDPVLFIPGMR